MSGWSITLIVVGSLSLGFCLVYVARYFLVRKWKRLHGELAGVIDGKTKAGRFFGAPKLIGTYNGVPVELKVLSKEDVSNAYKGNARILTMIPGGSGKDWVAYYGAKKTLARNLLNLSGGPKSWRIDTEDEVLKRRLIDAGVIATLQSWPDHPLIDYKAKEGSLSYVTLVKDHDFYSLPSPDQFKTQLALLADLSEINKRVNAG